MSRRKNGNRYERKMWHRRKNRALTYACGGGKKLSKVSNRTMRAQLRNQLHHTPLDDDWDIHVIPEDPWSYDQGCGGFAMNWHNWRTGKRDKRCPDLTAEEVRRLPPHARHRWKENEKPNGYISRWTGRTWYYPDYDKVLEILKAIFFTIKIGPLEKIVTIPNEWGGWLYLTLPKAYTHLDEWWRECRYKRDVTRELQKLGYNCWTTDKEKALPPDQRD